MDYDRLTKLLTFKQKETVEITNSLLSRHILSDDVVKQIINEPSERGATILSRNIRLLLDDPDLVPDTVFGLVQELKKHEFLKEFTQDLETKLKTSKQSNSASQNVVSSTPATESTSPDSTHSTKPRGGFDDDLFISKPPKSLQCPICLSTLRDPHLLECCGARMCQDCLQHSSGKFCPVCKNTSFKSILDKRTRGDILSLKVKCLNDPRCSWTGELLDLRLHQDTNCLYVTVPCPRGCGSNLHRSEWMDHLENTCKLGIVDAGKLDTMQLQLLSDVSNLSDQFKDESSVKQSLVSQFQQFLDRQLDVLVQPSKSSVESDAVRQAAIEEMKAQMNERFERQTKKMSEVSTAFDITTQVMKNPVVEGVIKNEERMYFQELLESNSKESETQKRRIQELEDQPLKLLDKVDKLLMRVKMASGKDAEITKLKIENIELRKQLSQGDEIEQKKDNDTLVTEKEKLQDEIEKLKKELQQAKEPKEDVEQKENDKKQRTSKSDFGMQFDYWIPMNDLLHGAVVVSENVFNVHGDKEQTFNWADCGFSLEVPKDALSPAETCPVAIKALISGRFMFPKGFQLLSAVYAISPGRKFTKDVKVTIQHCLQLEREEQLERLCFAKAYPTVCNTINPYYVFEIAKGGTFHIGSQLCEIWQRDFCHFCVGIRSQHDDDDDGNDNNDDDGNDNNDDDGNDNNDDDTSGSGSAAEDNQQQDDEHDVGSEQGHQATTPSRVDSGETPRDIRETSRDSSTSSLTTPPSITTPPSLTTPPTRTEPPSLNLPSSVGTPTMPSSLATPSSIATPSQQVSTTSTSEDVRRHEDIQLYRAHFFYKNISTNHWDFKLATVKQLDVHIKYITDQFVNDERIVSFGFRFAGPMIEPEIELEFPNRDSLPTGWVITPVTIPCSVSKEDIDTLSVTELTVQSGEQQRVYADIPMCKATVYAEDSPSTAGHIEYTVGVTGIQGQKSVVIARRKSNNTAPGVVDRQLQQVERPPQAAAQDENNNDFITVDEMKGNVKGAIQKLYATLKKLFDSNMDAVSAELVSLDVITRASQLSFDKILDDFYGGMDLCDDVNEVKDNVNQFLTAMIKTGGPLKKAAEKLKKSIKHL